MQQTGTDFRKLLGHVNSRRKIIEPKPVPQDE